MKRRDFLGAPVALVGLGLAVGGKAARAADLASTSASTGSLTFTLLRLSGSAGETETFGAWQEAWPQVPPSLAHARVLLHGLVRGSTNTLGNVNIETAFFGSGKNGVNTALAYVASDAFRPSGSGPIGFTAVAPNFGGFVVTPTASASSARSKEAATGTVVAFGDAATGRFAPGLYVVVHRPANASRFDASQFLYTGYDDRPLMLRDGRAAPTDYLAFSVEAA